MDWRIKCVACHILGAMPGGGSAHRALQRYVTGRHLLNISRNGLVVHRYHVENYQRLGIPGRALEFGAGPNLLSALMMSAAGASEVIAIDLARLATVERVNHVVRQLRQLQVPGQWAEVTDLGRDLEQRYRIRYLAPADARATGLPADSTDFIYSTSTLEHVDARDIASILRECRRVATRNGLISLAIDYKDHYAGFDRKISKANFYRYNDRQWAKYNPRYHFQNRLRHCDYERMFAELGLPIIAGSRHERGQADELQRVRLAPRFLRYAPEDLLTFNGRFLLAARPEAADVDQH
jgi:SAM-dependent methyltransferase